MEDEIMKSENEALTDYSPQGLISQALAQNLPVETLERLMDLAERWERAQAKKAFDKAMVLFQSQCPIIKKTKKGGKTKTGIVAYKYAPLEDVVAQTKELIAECGFSYLIKTPKFTNDSVEASCEVRHIAGHSETSTLTFPLVTKTEIMSAPHVVAGSVSFAKRYAFLNAFGIMTADEDNDAAKQKEPQEEIPAPIDINKEKEIKKCSTLEELEALYNRFSPKEQLTYKKIFSSVKSMILDSKGKER